MYNQKHDSTMFAKLYTFEMAKKVEMQLVLTCTNCIGSFDASNFRYSTLKIH